MMVREGPTLRRGIAAWHPGSVGSTAPAPDAVRLQAQVRQAVDVLEARKAAIGDGA
jgi:hypothetical protein